MNNSFQFDKSKLLHLEFVDDHISFDEIKRRAEQYSLPILFAYTAFPIDRNEQPHYGFQVAFLTDVNITNSKINLILLKALKVIFPEAIRSFNKSYGADLTDPLLKYFDQSIPEITVESLFRNMTLCLKDLRGDTNYKRYLKKFSVDTGIRLNQDDFLDISVKYGVDEYINSNDKISTSSIIKIYEDVENLSNIHYVYSLNLRILQTKIPTNGILHVLKTTPIITQEAL